MGRPHHAAPSQARIGKDRISTGTSRMIRKLAISSSRPSGGRIGPAGRARAPGAGGSSVSPRARRASKKRASRPAWRRKTSAGRLCRQSGQRWISSRPRPPSAARARRISSPESPAAKATCSRETKRRSGAAYEGALALNAKHPALLPVHPPEPQEGPQLLSQALQGALPGREAAVLPQRSALAIVRSGTTAPLPPERPSANRPREAWDARAPDMAARAEPKGARPYAIHPDPEGPPDAGCRQGCRAGSGLESSPAREDGPRQPPGPGREILLPCGAAADPDARAPPALPPRGKESRSDGWR
jgi:hypothetical protein